MNHLIQIFFLLLLQSIHILKLLFYLKSRRNNKKENSLVLQANLYSSNTKMW